MAAVYGHHGWLLCAPYLEGTLVIAARRLQRSFGEGLIAEAVDDLWEDWMRHADEVLEDEALITTAYEALAQRSRRSKTSGRP